MNYKKEDKEHIERSRRYSYYDFTEDEIERVIKTNVFEVKNDDWKMLIQMLYPENMIASGLFQPILIFKIKENGERIDPPIEAYNGIDDFKNGDCVLFRIIRYIERRRGDIEFDSSWYELMNKMQKVGE